MAPHHHRGAGAPSRAAPRLASLHPAGLAPPHQPGATAAGLTAFQKDETPGWQAEGFRGKNKADSRDSQGAIVLGQPAAAGPTMSSLEIADLVQCRHDNVKRTIDSLATRGTIVRPQSEDEHQTDALGRSRSLVVYMLDKRSSYIVVAQLSPEFTGALVDRWQHLEAQREKHGQPVVPTSFREALLLAAEQQEVIERQAQALAIAAPKAVALDRIATESEGAVSVRVAAKLAEVPERKFIDFLIQRGWLYRQGSRDGLQGKADKMREGLVEMKRVEVQRLDGTTVAVARVFITGRGLAKVAELLEREAPHLRKTKAPPDRQHTQLALPMGPADEQAGRAP